MDQLQQQMLTEVVELKFEFTMKSNQVPVVQPHRYFVFAPTDHAIGLRPPIPKVPMVPPLRSPYTFARLRQGIFQGQSYRVIGGGKVFRVQFEQVGRSQGVKAPRFDRGIPQVRILPTQISIPITRFYRRYIESLMPPPIPKGSEGTYLQGPLYIVVYNNEVDTYGTVKVEAASFVFMVEMVDTPDLKSCAFKRPSSILGEDTSAPRQRPYHRYLWHSIYLRMKRPRQIERILRVRYLVHGISLCFARVDRVSTVGNINKEKWLSWSKAPHCKCGLIEFARSNRAFSIRQGTYGTPHAVSKDIPIPLLRCCAISTCRRYLWYGAWVPSLKVLYLEHSWIQGTTGNSIKPSPFWEHQYQET